MSLYPFIIYIYKKCKFGKLRFQIKFITFKQNMQLIRIHHRLEKEVLEAKDKFKVEKIMEEDQNRIVGVKATIPFLGQTILSFAPDHPFRPPRISVNGGRLHDALGKLTLQQYHRYSELFGGECPCCDLPFANKNWAPSMTIFYILSSIQEMVHRRHRVIYENTVNRILSHYNLPEHLPILEFI